MEFSRELLDRGHLKSSSVSPWTVTLRVYLTETPQLEPTDVVTQRFLFTNVRIRPGHT